MIPIVEEAKQFLGSALGTFVENEYREGLIGTPQSVIQQAETHLNLKLPRDYQSFVEEYGGFFSPAVFIYGISNNDFENPMVCDGVRATLQARKTTGLPHHLYLVVDEDGDEFHCIDSFTGGVVNWSPYHQSVVEVLAQTFKVYLEQQVQRAIDQKKRHL